MTVEADKAARVAASASATDKLVLAYPGLLWVKAIASIAKKGIINLIILALCSSVLAPMLVLSYRLCLMLSHL